MKNNLIIAQVDGEKAGDLQVNQKMKFFLS